MPIRKRFLNIYVIAAALVLLLGLSCYLTARKMMGSDIELGMSKAELIQRLGTPLFDVGSTSGDGVLQWDKIVINEKVYHQVIYAVIDADENAKSASLHNWIFGYKFQSTIQPK